MTIHHETDVLVIGSGIAGMRGALTAARAGARVCIVSLGTGGSPDIMGFSAPVLPGDSADLVLADINASGQGVNNPALARVFAQGTEEIVPDLDIMGVPLKKDVTGRCIPLQALGTSYPRLVHHYRCMTGVEILKKLRRQLSDQDVQSIRGVMIFDLLLDKGAVCGALGIDVDSGELQVFKCRAVLLTTGGSGRIHAFSTYPADITGDGMAMAYRAGLDLVDMEFLQFEPCGFVTPDAIRGSLVPTTLLKAGAELRNANQEQFVTDFSSIQKDELSRRIHREIQEGRGTPAGGVWYDVTMLPESLVKENHAIFYEPALRGGIDISKEPAQMAPSAHTFLGGVVARPDCATAVTGLFAAGEILGGVHGANRIGGDGGASALVFGKVVGSTLASQYADLPIATETRVLDLAREGSDFLDVARARQNGESPGPLREALRELMQAQVGIIRTESGLAQAAQKLEELEAAATQCSISQAREAGQLCSLWNMLLTARMMIGSASLRTESRGAHFREDFPDRAEDWQGVNVIVRKQDQDMQFAKRQSA